MSDSTSNHLEWEERYRTLFEQAPIGVFLYDRTFRIVECNSAFVDILESTMEKLRGLDLRKLKDTRIMPAIEGVFEGGTTTYEGPYTATTSNAKIHISMRLAPLRNAQGEVTLGMGLVENITERRLIQARLVHTDRMVAMGTLAAGIAHEINNPLAYLSANLDLIVKRKLPDVQERLQRLVAKLGAEHAFGESGLADSIQSCCDMLGVAQDGATRVKEIVRDLKTFSRDDERRTEIDVRRVIDACLNIAAGDIRAKARIVKLYNDVPTVLASESRLGQVFLNLIVNAVQSIPESKTKGSELTVKTFREGDNVVVEISDGGEGMSQETMSRIFEPFFTTKPAGVGTGLGLWVCQAIVQALGGTLTAESTVGVGTTMRVSLPVAPRVSAE